MTKNGWKESTSPTADIFWSGTNLKSNNLDLCFQMRINKFPGQNYLF